jgi:ribonucleoside-diphosphate reductase beta chain
MSYSVFNLNSTDIGRKLFLGTPINIARYDQAKWPFLLKLARKAEGFYWQPENTTLAKDMQDFKTLSPEEEHIFTSNLKRQILLDSVQGRALSAAFGPITTLPELEGWWKVQEYWERIHNRSYTYILQNVYPNPSKVFDEILDIQEIADCAKDVTEEYDRLIRMNQSYSSDYTDSHDPDYVLRMKRQIWRTIHAVNFLEGIRFYVSFICSWAFAEGGKMEGNAKIIKLIARDENIHLGFSQQMIKTLPKDDPDYIKIAEEETDYVANMAKSVIDQEKAWAKYLCSKGSMIGINEDILCDAVDYFGGKRTKAIGIQGFKQRENPLPWVDKWIAGSEIQEAPQETEKSAYIIGGMNTNIKETAFKGFEL